MGSNGNLREFFDGLEDAVRQNKEYTQQIGSTQEAMVTVTKQLTEQLAISQVVLKEALAQNATLLEILQKQGVNLGTMNVPVGMQAVANGKPKCTCKHCKKEVTHEDDNCFSLEKNKDKHPGWWREPGGK